MNSYEAKLKELDSENNLRIIPETEKKEGKFIILNDKRLLNLSSNDYLAVGNNKLMLADFIEQKQFSPQFLFSSTSSRLLSGNTSIYKKLENNLAKLFHKEAALLFNTGYQCNLGVISTLFDKDDVIFCDKLNHASIIDGIKLSGATMHRYKHLDYTQLEDLLTKHRKNHKRAIIISESVFSMDGDIADIEKLVKLKEQYDTMLMIDEAHAFGVFGRELCGVAEEADLLNKVDIVTATFGKSFASTGAFVVADKVIIDYLINKCRSFIFSTALPPANVMWTNWLLKKKSNVMKIQRKKLRELTRQTLSYMSAIGMSTVSHSQIIPIIIGDSKKTVELAKYVQDKGFYVLAVRPPSVPPNSSRLRLSLTADVNFEEVRRALDFIKNFCNES